MGAANKSLVVVDLETTGLDPDVDGIVEIGSCLLSRTSLTEEDSFHTRVDSGVRMTDAAYRLHGLAHRDLVGQPKIDEAVSLFAEYAPANAILTGHNVHFDIAFLRKAYLAAGIPFDFDYHLLDVWSVAYFVLRAEGIALDSYSLTALCSLFGIPRGPRHNAFEDARASAAILRHLSLVERGEPMELLGQYRLID